MKILEVEETEDFALHGGHAPLNKPYLAVSAFGLARARGVWLLVLIIAAALTVNVLQYFEEILESAVVLALFIPLLIDTGGNSGAQASTARQAGADQVHEGSPRLVGVARERG